MKKIKLKIENDNGFTLIELLISLTIFSVLLMIIFSILIQVIQLSALTNERSYLRSTLSNSISTITRDLNTVNDSDLNICNSYRSSSFYDCSDTYTTGNIIRFKYTPSPQYPVISSSGNPLTYYEIIEVLENQTVNGRTLNILHKIAYSDDGNGTIQTYTDSDLTTFPVDIDTSVPLFSRSNKYITVSFIGMIHPPTNSYISESELQLALTSLIGLK